MGKPEFLRIALGLITHLRWSPPANELHYLFSALRSSGRNLPFAVSWTDCFFPFPDEQQIICCEFYDIASETEVFLVLSSRAILVNGNPLQKHYMTSHNSSTNGLYYSFSSRRGNHSFNGISSELERKIIAFIGGTALSWNEIDELDFPLLVKKPLETFKRDYEKFCVRLSEITETSSLASDLDRAKAILLCIPNLEKPDKSNSKILSSYKWPIFQNDKIRIEANELSHEGSYERDYYTRQIREAGFIELQLLLESGKVVKYIDHNLLNQHCLPSTKQEKSLKPLADFRFLNSGIESYLHHDEKKKLQTIESYSELGFPLYLTLGYDTLKDRIYWPLKKVSFGSPTSEAPIAVSLRPIAETTDTSGSKQSNSDLACLGQIDFHFEAKQKYSFDLISNQGIFNFSEAHLFIHQWYGLLSDFYADFPIDELDNHDSKTDSLIEKILQLDSRVCVKRHEVISAKLQLLKTKYRAFFDSSSIIVQDMEYRALTIDARPEGFKFYHRFGPPQMESSADVSNEISLTHFSPQWKEVFEGLNHGFSALLPEQEKDSLAGRKNPNRAENLKLLRHTGAFTFIVHSCLNRLFEKPESRLTHKAFLTEIFSKLKILLCSKKLSDVEEVPFSNIYSKKVEAFISKYIESLLNFLQQTNDYFIFYQGSAYNCRGLNYHQAKVIFFILNQILGNTKGAFFSGSKNKWTEFWHPSRLLSLQEALFIYDLDFISSAPDAIGLLGPKSLESGMAVFNNERELSASPIVANFLSSSIDQNNSFFSWLHWPRIKSQFEESQVLLKGKPIESLDLNSFKYEFTVSAADKGAGSDKQNNGTINWFDLHPQYFLNGKPINPYVAQTLAHEGIVEYEGTFYVIDVRKLPNQKALELFWSKLAGRSLGNAGGASGARSKQAQQTRHHILELLVLRKMGIPFKGPAEWQAVCDYFDALSDPKQNVQLSEPLSQILKPYQKGGVQWLWDLYHLKIGGILADDMGLGKTLQTLSFIELLKSQRKAHRTLVVVPVSLVYNWISECEKFTPGLKTFFFDPAKDLHEDIDLVICTYGLFALHHEKLSVAQFQCVFFDEAQNLKNRGTERFEAAVQLQVPFKIALTGTPLENHLGNLYALMAVVAPGVLGNSSDFSREYMKTAGASAESISFLRAQLKPLILRRTKEQILKELPEKIETQIKIDFSPRQKALYKKTALAYSEKISEIIAKEGESKSQLQMLTALLRLRQICSDPNALPGVNFKEVPPKLECLMEMLGEIIEEGHSVILFTQFITTFNRIKTMATDRGIPILSLCGADSRTARIKTLEDFNEQSGGSVLLMTLKTGGVGLNLTKASYVFHLEPWWNPAVENQATDRVHRIGQTKSISVYRLIMKESVEEKVELLKARKGALFNQMFGEEYFSNESGESDSHTPSKQNTSALSKKDFDVLLS